MKRRVSVAITATVVAAALASAGGAQAEPLAHAAETLPVKSSIADGAVLSSPLHWQAIPSGMAAGDSVARVECLIDGKLRWTALPG